MKKNTVENQGWKQAKNLADMKRSIELGFLLSWKDAKNLKKMLSIEECNELSMCFASHFCNGSEDRIYLELIAESFLVFVANSMDEQGVNAFLDFMMAHPRKIDAVRSFVEICLTSETTDHAHDIQVYALAVAMICELGIKTWHEISVNPEMQEANQHITTYLLSVSNQNNTSIRLSLLNYFGRMAMVDEGHKKAFNRMMSRFGHTVLDQLFTLLFAKKSESVALLYLCENLPYVFLADNQSQRILHETFRFYLLKKPERFVLFLNYFSQMQQKVENNMLLGIFLQHVAALYGVVSELNHKSLAREIVSVMAKFQDREVFQVMLQEYLQKGNMKPYFDQLFRSLIKDSPVYRDSLFAFHSAKRGRRPSFSRAPEITTFSQVYFLGNLDLSKAS